MEGDSKFGFRFLQHKSRKAWMDKSKKSRKAATKRDVGHFLRGPVPPIIAFYALPPSFRFRGCPSLSLSLFLSCARACNFITANAANVIAAVIERASVAECDIRRATRGLDDGNGIGAQSRKREREREATLALYLRALRIYKYM